MTIQKYSVLRYGHRKSSFKFKKKTFKPSTDPLLIYECHIGMAQQEEKVGTYNEFREKILPLYCQRGIQLHSDYGYTGAPILW